MPFGFHFEGSWTPHALAARKNDEFQTSPRGFRENAPAGPADPCARCRMGASPATGSDTPMEQAMTVKFGTNADDFIDVSWWSDAQVFAYDGNDTIYLSRGKDTVSGGRGTDIITDIRPYWGHGGYLGADVVQGGAGGDIID